jgi:E3 ubiquitin-protein ligase ZNF598
MKITYKQEVKLEDFLPKEEELETVDCLICCEPMKLFAVLECDHHQVCGKCILIQRVLMNDKKCCICKVKFNHKINKKKQETTNAFITKNPPKNHSTYDVGKLIYDQEWNLYYENKIVFQELSELKVLKCLPFVFIFF